MCTVFLCGCDSLVQYLPIGHNEKDTETSVVDIDEVEEYVIPEPLESDGLIYDMLSDLEKSIYTRLYYSVLNGETECVMKKAPIGEYEAAIPRVVKAFLFEHPELFYYNSGYSYTRSSSEPDAIGTIKLRLSEYSFYSDSDKKQEMISALNERVDVIVKKASSLTSDYEKVLFVHNEIVNTTVYDTESASSLSGDGMTHEQQMTHTAYGALVNHSAVCDGYSKAFGIILTALDIENLYVTGYGKTTAHAWSCVKIGGEFYYIDLTWDDPSAVNLPTKNNVTYTYFAMTTEQLERTHTIDDHFTYPVCTATEYSYYRYNGMYLDKYTFKSFSSIVEAQKDSSSIYIAFSTKEEYERALKDVITNGRFSSIPLLSGSSLRYSRDDDNFVLTIYPQSAK